MVLVGNTNNLDTPEHENHHPEPENGGGGDSPGTPPYPDEDDNDGDAQPEGGRGWQAPEHPPMNPAVTATMKSACMAQVFLMIFFSGAKFSTFGASTKA